METGDEKSKNESLPPGFRFHPSDEELITYYLANKISDPSFVCRAVADVDLNKCEPWDLPGKAKMRGKEWYFFSLRDRKYPTGVRTNRATSTGYWKTTGKDKEIYNKVSIELVGMKKTLVFYKGRAPRGEKTSWVMHEYRLHSTSAYRSAKDQWVVCRVFQKSVGIKKYPTTTQQSSCSRSIIDLEMGTNQLVLPIAPTQYPSMGQNYMVMNNLELVELSRALRNDGGSTSTPLPIHHPLDGAGAGASAGDGGFTISSLNLNLGASQGPSLRPMMIQQGATQDHVMTSSMLNGLEHGYDGSLDMNNVDNCVDQFDDSSYWPNY